MRPPSRLGINTSTSVYGLLQHELSFQETTLCWTSLPPLSFKNFKKGQQLREDVISMSILAACSLSSFPLPR